jgi:hypothetical protein
MKPTRIWSELIDKLNKIEDEIEDEDKKDDNIKLMTDREFIHYVLERSWRSDRSIWSS